MTESIYITMRKNFCFYGGKERKGGQFDLSVDNRGF